jgi:hypothetical protein
MRTYKTIMHPTVVEVRIVCNKCGREMNLDTTEYEEFMTDFIHKFKVGYGFGSDRDGTLCQFDLCEDCLEWLYSTFKVPVRNTDGWNWEKDYNDCK